MKNRAPNEILFLRVLLASLMCVSSACSLHSVGDWDRPGVEVPESYHHTEAMGENRLAGIAPEERWWRAFGDPGLDEAVEGALRGNLDLRQAWSRLAQARALVTIEGADRYPQLDLGGSASRLRSEVDDTTTRSSSYLVSSGLSYELDVWRRVAESHEAALLTYRATRQDLESTALVLSGDVVSTWFAIQETKALLELLNAQIETSKRLLRLTETRFATGGGSGLDVIQQRQQLESARLEIPNIESRLETLRHRLAILLGRAPSLEMDRTLAREPDAELPALPEFPTLVGPADLLETRPDLRAARLRLESADHEVAVAIADRLPRLGISFDYEFRAAHVSDLVDNELRSLTGNLIAPLIDGGRRRAEVRRREAIVDERLNAFGEAYINALGEVEDALVRERYQLELIEKLEGQILLGEQNLTYSRIRYVNGLTDYLSVLAAVQQLQDLERRLVIEKRSLLEIRSGLYRAMGGAWGGALEPPNVTSACKPPSMQTTEGVERCAS